MLALALPLLLGAASAPPEPVALPDTAVERLVARANGVAYRLLVAAPPGHAGRDGEIQAVLLLDADYAFPVAFSISTHLRERSDLPDLLVVAVGYDGPPAYKLNRTRDYTPTHVATGGYGPEFQRASGGAPAFLTFLEEELMPLLRARYRAAPRPVLVGHSYGGLFATWVAMNRPELLAGAIAVSPSLWYDGRLLERQEAALPPERRAGPLKLYAAVGALEGNAQHDMVADLVRLGDRLRPPRWPRLEARVEVLDGETHNSVFPRALSNGLRFLWPRGTFTPSRAPGTRPPF
jgi:predicted alpha/beta superfamily hydrolase